MKYYFFLLLFISIFQLAYSQDKLLSKNRDTLLVKVSSIENQKVLYQLANGSQNSTQSAEISTLHKIIWRNGKELIFDKNLEEILIKEKVTIKTKEAEAVVVKKQTLPILSYKGLIFTQFYENGEKVSQYRVKEILQYYDKSDLPTFQEGYNLSDKSKKASLGILGVVGGIYAIRETAISINNLNMANPKPQTSGTLATVGFAVAGITFLVMKIKANSLMQVAVDNYNKR